MLDAFAASGPSPTDAAAARRLRQSANYRIDRISFTLVREPGAVVLGPVAGPADVVELVQHLALIPDDAREHFIALYLNAKNTVVAWHEVSVGTLTGSLVHPREVFGPALRLLGVAGMILIHNHPSGDPTPSREDLRLTRQLSDAGKVLDVPVHDHVVLGSGTGTWVSLAERGVL